MSTSLCIAGEFTKYVSHSTHTRPASPTHTSYSCTFVLAALLQQVIPPSVEALLTMKLLLHRLVMLPI